MQRVFKGRMATPVWLVLAAMAMAVAAVAPSSAVASETAPEAVFNVHKFPNEENPKAFLSWGSLKITTNPETSKVGEVECMNIFWGSLWNAGPAPRGHGLILGSSDDGHLTSTAFPTPKLTEPNAAKCRWVEEGGKLVSPTLEIYLAAEEPTSEDKHKLVSTPWKLEFKCSFDEAEETNLPVVKIGVPYEKVDGEPWPESPDSCTTTEEEKAEVEAQERAGLRDSKKLENVEPLTVAEEEEAACYDPIAALNSSVLLRGCIRIDAVEPSLSAEAPFLGSLRLLMRDGASNGLDFSRLLFQDQQPAGGALYRETSMGERAKGYPSGKLLLTGEEELELITAK